MAAKLKALASTTSEVAGQARQCDDVNHLFKFNCCLSADVDLRLLVFFFSCFAVTLFCCCVAPEMFSVGTGVSICELIFIFG